MRDDRPRTSRTRRLVRFAVGVVLLASAVWFVAEHQESVLGAMDRAGRAPWWLVAVLLVLPLLNAMVISLSLVALYRPIRVIDTREMTGLVCAAWLMNYLPMRPGMFGRIAYHRRYHGVRVTDSVRIIGVSIGIEGVLVLALLLISAVLGGEPAAGPWVAAIGGMGAILALGILFARAVGGARGRAIAVAALFRFVDLLIWTARYAAAFAIVGRHLSVGQAIAMASVSQVALLIPFAGNGLGIREWAIGLTSKALGSLMAAGLAADLVNRGLEVLAAVPTGLLGIWAISRLRRKGREESGPITDESPDP